MWGRCYDLHSAGDAREIKTLFNPTQSARGLPRGDRVPLQDGSEVRSLMPGDEQGLTCRAALLWWKSYSKSKKSRGRAVMSWLQNGSPRPSCLRKKKPTFIKSLPSLYHRYHSPFSVCCAAATAPTLWLGSINHLGRLQKLPSPAWLLTCPPLPGEGKCSWQTFRAWRLIGLRLQKPAESRRQLQWFVSTEYECLCPFLQWQHPTGSLPVTMVGVFPSGKSANQESRLSLPPLKSH